MSPERISVGKEGNNVGFCLCNRRLLCKLLRFNCGCSIVCLTYSPERYLSCAADEVAVKPAHTPCLLQPDSTILTIKT